MPSLRGRLRPREGAGQLPALLLDLGPLPYRRPAALGRKASREFFGEEERVLGHGHQSAHY